LLNNRDWMGSLNLAIGLKLSYSFLNEIEISYTTTLTNYANSLTNNEVAQRWTNLQQPDHMGLSSDVRLLKSR